MTDGQDGLIRQIENAADNIGDVPRHQLQILLRRAAMRLRNSSDEPEDIERKIQEISKDLDEPNGLG